MSRLLVIILFSLSTKVCAQMTEVVRKHYTNAIEEYSVLKADRNIKHGIYRQFSTDKKLLVEGYYHNGIQSSFWKQYNLSGKLISQGSYSNGYKAGAWEYYDTKGKLLQKYDYTAQQLIYYLKDVATKNKLYRVVADNGIIETKLSRPPMFIGGINTLNSLIKSSVADIAVNKKQALTVVFTIKKNGEATDHHYKTPSTTADNAILDVVKSLPNFWIPGVLNGEPVDVIFELPVTFDED